MSLNETMNDWKKQASEQAKENLNEQNHLNQSQESVSEREPQISLPLSKLEKLIASEVSKAIEKLTNQSPAPNLESKLDQTSQQFNQFRLQQKQTNDSLKQETNNLRRQTKESFNGLGNLIQEKLKPLNELNQKLSKQLPPPKKTPLQLPGSTKTNPSTSRSTPKTNISENSKPTGYASSSHNSSTRQPEITYLPPPQVQSQKTSLPRQISREPEYQEPEMKIPLWYQTVNQVGNFLLKQEAFRCFILHR